MLEQNRKEKASFGLRKFPLDFRSLSSTEAAADNNKIESMQRDLCGGGRF